MNERDDPARLLRRTLAVNAVTSAACGAAFLVSGHPLAALFGCAPAFLWAFGAGLLAFAGHLAYVSRKPAITRGDALYFATADAAYVAGSAVLLLGWPDLLTGAGRLFFAVVADTVAVFSVLEFVGYRRLAQAPSLATA